MMLRLPAASLLPGLISLVLFATDSASASDWLHWRGPHANGSATADAAPPATWSDSENIRWVADLPGEGTSTPIVVGDRIFVTSAVATSKPGTSPVPVDPTSKTIPPGVYYRFVVTAIDRRTGKELWTDTATEQVPHEGHHPTHTYAAGSPTSDGQNLYVSFGSFGIYCYSLDGRRLWERDLGDMHTRFGWGEAVTPVVHGDRIIVNWDQERDSFITALSVKDGSDIWRQARPGEVTSWNTPLVAQTDTGTQVVVNGTGFVTSYDADTGDVVWKCGGQTVNAIPSPLRFEDTAICMSGYRGAAAMAIPLDSTGDVTGSEALRWTWNQGTPYVPSATLSGNRLFFTAVNTDVMTCLDARTGMPIGGRTRLSGVGSLYASGLAAGGHLYFVGREGTTFVLRDDDSLEVVSVNRLNSPIDASPVAVDKDLILRGWNRLYCLAGD